jgi:membrane associated rhomboid family serine protease
MQLPQSWSSARATLVIAGTTACLWLIVAALGLDGYAALWGGFIPARVGGGIEDAVLAPVFLTPLTAALIHSGFVHLVFNLVVLLFCGRSIEPILGKAGVVILYLVGAYVAAAAEYFVNPDAAIPMIGASGAVSAILGAYAMLFGRNKVKLANPALALAVHVLWLAAAWIALQLLVGFAFVPSGTNGIAVFAHIGGFIAGIALARPLLLLKWRGA